MLVKRLIPCFLLFSFSGGIAFVIPVDRILGRLSICYPFRVLFCLRFAVRCVGLRREKLVLILSGIIRKTLPFVVRKCFTF